MYLLCTSVSYHHRFYFFLICLVLLSLISTSAPSIISTSYTICKSTYWCGCLLLALLRSWYLLSSSAIISSHRCSSSQLVLTYSTLIILYTSLMIDGHTRIASYWLLIERYHSLTKLTHGTTYHCHIGRVISRLVYLCLNSRQVKTIWLFNY